MGVGFRPLRTRSTTDGPDLFPSIVLHGPTPLHWCRYRRSDVQSRHTERPSVHLWSSVIRTLSKDNTVGLSFFSGSSPVALHRVSPFPDPPYTGPLVVEVGTEYPREGFECGPGGKLVGTTVGLFVVTGCLLFPLGSFYSVHESFPSPTSFALDSKLRFQN